MELGLLGAKGQRALPEPEGCGDSHGSSCVLPGQSTRLSGAEDTLVHQSQVLNSLLNLLAWTRI